MLVYVSIGAFELQCENIGAFELKCENIGSYEQQRENRRNECQGLATNGKHVLTMSVLREHSAPAVRVRTHMNMSRLQGRQLHSINQPSFVCNFYPLL